MDKARHKRNYDLHSWSGITLGIFLYIVCFTGAVAVFALSETRVWEDPAARITYSGEPAPFTETFDRWVNDQEQLGEIEYLGMSWPSPTNPFYGAYADIHLDASDEHKWVSQRWHPETLELVPTREASMSGWLVDFHTHLKWPAKLGGQNLGGFIVGLAGILLLLAVLTGVVAHTKLKEEAFSLRFDKSIRLRWQDTHKVIGLWGAPFHAMIGFTGAMLGIITTLTPVMAVLAFQGNTSALFAAFDGEIQVASGVPAEMISLEDLHAMVHPESGLAPVSASVDHYGDANASYTAWWPATDRLSDGHAFKVSAITGEALPLEPLRETDAIFKRINAAVVPLHFGFFGGIVLKFVWFFLGLSLSVITALGTMMWIERRQYGNAGSRSDKFYDRLSKLNVGVCTGLAVCTAGLFVHNVVYWGDEAGRGISIAWCYLGVWGIAIVYAFIRDGVYKANRELVGTTGVMLVLAATLNQLLTELPAGGIGVHSRTLVTDLTLVAFGVSTIAIAKMLPQKRSEKKRIGREAKTELLDNDVPAPAE